jgi:hypothetical protein
MINRELIRFICLLLIFAGCGNPRPEDLSIEDLNSPEPVLVLSAVEAFAEMQSAGAVPGISESDRWSLKAPIRDFSSKRVIPYPQSVEIEITKSDQTQSTYHYLLSRKVAGASWAIEKAWRVDFDGHVTHF